MTISEQDGVFLLSGGTGYALCPAESFQFILNEGRDAMRKRIQNLGLVPIGASDSSVLAEWHRDLKRRVAVTLDREEDR